MRNDYNEQVQKENNAKADEARKANREARRHAPATPAPSAPAVAENTTPAPAVPAPAPLPHPEPVPAAPKPSAEPGKVNWSLQPGVKVRQSSNRNMLGAYGPEKAVDGNTSSELSDGFHQRHRRGGRKNRLVRHRLRQGRPTAP